MEEEFQRTVTYAVKAREDNRAVLRSLLQDRFHDIEATVVIDLASLEILDTAIEFRKAPSATCVRAGERAAMLHGFVIARGLSRKLADAFGGPQGCGNLRTMLGGLLPLALNLQACAGHTDEQEICDTIYQKLVGTCAGYVQPTETPPA